SDESDESRSREDGLAKRTQAIPRSEWHVRQAGEIRRTRLHPYKTSPSAQSRNCLRINFSPGSRRERVSLRSSQQVHLSPAGRGRNGRLAPIPGEGATTRKADPPHPDRATAIRPL